MAFYWEKDLKTFCYLKYSFKWNSKDFGRIHFLGNLNQLIFDFFIDSYTKIETMKLKDWHDVASQI